ncbi:MAG: mannose-1-phosphate guanylyltransferase [Ignavibacteria bacterium]|nr:mannose-1-phosphate guanylyltransferase [Ignavibacteria bacterium]
MTSYAVIMAGGSGERFWPYSRKSKPKQLLRLTSPHKTMIEEAIERIRPIIPLERILIITSKVLRAEIINAVPFFPAANVIAEPAKRNTAPCLALGASVIKTRLKETKETDAVMCVFTADHFIGDNDAFDRDVRLSIEKAAEGDVLVTLGVIPTRPDTGYGYIEVQERGPAPMKVSSFREKPNADVAIEYMKSGRYLWNSGMFVWRISSFEQAMRTHLPQVAEIISMDGDIDERYKALPDISIDYGIMEKASNVFVVPAEFPWDDVGSWDALDRLQNVSDGKNVEYGRVDVVDSSSAIVVNASTKGQVVSALGVANIVVVLTDDAVLVCDKSRAQDVKQIVSSLKSKGWDEYL